MRKRLVLALAFLALAGVWHTTFTFASTYEEGWAAYRAEQYDQAYDIFSTLFKESPDNQDLQFALGMAALKKGKLSHAAFAFERILSDHPGHQRARLELARTYAAMGLYEQARKEFQDVLEAQPPEQVARNVDVFMRQIKTLQRPWKISGQLSLNGLYDDNANYGPSDFTVDTAIGPLQVATSSLPVKAWGAALSGALRGVYDIGRRQGWMARAEVSGYQSWLDEARDQDVGFYRALAGFSLSGTRTYLDLPLKCDYMEYGHDSLLTIFGTEPMLVFMPSTTWQHITRLILEHRVYRLGSDRDGPYAKATQTAKRYFGESLHSVSLSAGYFYEDVESPAYDNHGWEVGAGTELRVGWGISTYAWLQYMEPSYREELLPDLQKDPRQDRQFQVLVGAQKVFKNRWGLDASYRHINNESNFGLYDYKRNVFSLSSFVYF